MKCPYPEGVVETLASGEEKEEREEEEEEEGDEVEALAIGDRPTVDGGVVFAWKMKCDKN